MSVLVLEPVAAEGLEILRRAGLEVVDGVALQGAEREAALAEAQALVVRSATRVDVGLLDRAPRLRAVARAGAGLDNVDLKACTARGVAVVNTPGGNSIAAAEMTLALLLGLARHVGHAHQAMAGGGWDRHRFTGIELAGRTLGVVGLGRIGALVAERARAFGMEVLGADPYLSPERAEAMGVRLRELDDLLAEADAVTLHLPLTEGTRGLLDAARLARMKRGALLVNCARGGLVDEAALARALDEGRLLGAAVDVYSTEPPPPGHPLVGRDDVLHTPHLGASTREAKENVSLDAARMLVALLRDGDWSVAVNLPYAGGALQRLAPQLDLAERLGRFQAGLQSAGPGRAEVELAGGEDGEAGPLLQAFLCGLLAPAFGDNVNLVNAHLRAQQLGWTFAHSRRPPEPGYPHRLITRVRSGEVEHQVEGALLAEHEPRVVRVDGRWLDLLPAGDQLVLRNRDVPGVLGRVGTLLGAHGINIGELRLGRRPGSEIAVSVWQVDQPVDEAVRAEVAALPEVREVRQVRLGPPPPGRPSYQAEK